MSVKVIAQTILYSSVNTPRLIHVYAIFCEIFDLYRCDIVEMTTMPLKVIGMTMNATQSHWQWHSSSAVNHTLLAVCLPL